ncbi:MAG: Crp/Fnr family transcriptional regulator [Bacilli bacterium]
MTEEKDVLSSKIVSLLQQEMINTEKQHFRKGEFLFAEGDCNHDVYVLMQGVVSLEKTHVKGLNKVITLMNAPRTIVIGIGQKMASVSVRARTNVVVKKVPMPLFRKWIKNDGEFALLVVERQSFFANVLLRQLKNGVNIKTESKVYSKLWRLGYEYGCAIDEKFTLISLPISVTFLSEMVGCNRETSSRILNDLIRRNLLRKNKEGWAIDMIEIKKRMKEE